MLLETDVFLLLIMIFAISVAAFVFVYSGKIRQSAAPLMESLWPEFQRLAQEREIILDNLKDIEIDNQMNKLSKEDYIRMRDELLERAGQRSLALEKLEGDHPLFKKIEEDLAKLEAKSP